MICKKLSAVWFTGLVTAEYYLSDMKKVVFVQGLSELLQIMDYSLLWAYHILC